MMEPRYLEVDTAGSAGSATGVAQCIVHGARLLAVSVDYNDAAPATTVVTITNPGLAGGHTVVVPAGNTDKTVYPRSPVQKSSDGTDLTQPAEPPLMHGLVEATVTSSDPLSPAAGVRLFFE
jgi:hypothetical protein